MNLATQLAQFNPKTATPESLAEQIAGWISQAKIHEEERIKNTAELNKNKEEISKNKKELSKNKEELNKNKAELAKKNQEIATHCEALQKQQEELRYKDHKISALTVELAYLKRIKFQKKSEAFVGQQRDLFEETSDIDFAAISANIEKLPPAKPSTKKKPTGRKPFSPDLPRIEFRHEPESCTCTQCAQELIKIGEDISEQLHVTPPVFSVHRHIRPQYACRHCETITAAPIPASIIDGGMATSGLHAWVIIQKYGDHLPLYRIEQIAARHGADISRSTMADWVGRIGEALKPLSEKLSALLKRRQILHADETPVPLLNPGKGKTDKAYLWAYRSTPFDTGPPIIMFDFQPSRAGKHANNFLQNWEGHLMVDDYAGYKHLFADTASRGIVELGCLAHVRRKFFDLYAANKHTVAEEALRRIGILYGYEREWAALCCAERGRLRMEKAKPEVIALQTWLMTQRIAAAQGSALAKALDYALKRWTAVARYTEDGAFPLDNNAVENAIRPIALGRKNWLFAGSERAGKRAAAIQSLFATAKANGIDPYVWLQDTLEKLATWPNSRIEELLPLTVNGA
jgi:transposase